MRRTLHVALIGVALIVVAAADTQPRVSIPQLASAQFGWLADTEFLPPTRGPSPVTFDQVHPYITSATTRRDNRRSGSPTPPIPSFSPGSSRA